MSYTTSLFHIVFCTKKREGVLTQSHRDELLRYIYGIAEQLNCNIICANIRPEHVHILAKLNATISLSNFVGTVKQSTSLWLKGNTAFRHFSGWAKEYYGVSVSPSNMDSVKRYIATQDQHHIGRAFMDEIQWLVEATGQHYRESMS